MRNYHNTTNKCESPQEVLDFLKKMFDDLPKGMVMDYISVERPYDDPQNYHVEFSSRTPHPDYDTLHTEDPIGAVFYPNKETK